MSSPLASKNPETETLVTQLARLKTKITSIETTIYKLAQQYSRLPLALRNDSCIPTATRDTLQHSFFEADETAQDRFWGRAIRQARFVTESLEATMMWCERMREMGHLKKKRGLFGPLDVGMARRALAIALNGLGEVETRVLQLRYDVSVFGEQEREAFHEQGCEDMQMCFDGVRRFLYFWPGMERELDLDLQLKVMEFLGLEEVEGVKGLREGGMGIRAFGWGGKVRILGG